MAEPSRWRPTALVPADYSLATFGSDLGAGVITATLLIPQAMAYSQLAGLPPQIGLYASMLPPILYALAGSSRTLAVGPVAVASLMLAGSLGSFWSPGSPEYLQGAFIVAGLSGVLLTIMGVAKLGVVANFLSHPVLSGFTNAAALIIVVSQLKHLFGVLLPQGAMYETLIRFTQNLHQINPVTLALGTTGVVFLITIARFGKLLATRIGLSARAAEILVRLAPLALVVAGTIVVASYGLSSSAGVAVTGDIPRGLPALSLPSFEIDLWLKLFAASLAIALVSFVESLSIAKVLASRRRQRIDPDRELIGLGVANIGASVTGASPVCGGFSRSVVNFEAGAQTQVAAIVCSVLIALVAQFFTPWLYSLPTAILAAIVIVSVSGLFDLHTLRLCWRYDKADAFALLATFCTVLVMGMEIGIAAGVVLSLLLFLWRASRPHFAVVGRVGDSEHFRNVDRHEVTTYPGVLAIRVDESLYFANTQTLEARLLNAVAEKLDVRHLLLICNAVNRIDTSALESLENLVVELRNAGVTLHLAEVKGPVADRLAHSNFLAQLAPGKVYLSTHEAIDELSK